MRIFTAPLCTTLNKSSAMAWVASRVAMCVKSVARVMYSEPLGPKLPTAKGGTGPDALPKLAIKPKGRKQSRLRSKVSLPMLS